MFFMSLMLAATGASTPYLRVDFEPAASARVAIAADPADRRAGDRADGARRRAGDRTDEARLDLPHQPPATRVRDSRFSPLMRARDLFDLTAYPARAVAKLHRLDAAGARDGTACTAQFIGPRHLLTAGHCLVDRTDGTPHPGFEVAIGEDAGVARQTLRATRAWIEVDQLLLGEPINALVTDDRCTDFGVVEVAEPVGERVGWLPIVAISASDAQTRGALHRFSYPHRPAGELVAGDEEKYPAEVRAVIAKQVAALRLSEPDFTAGNLYYEHGTADEVAPSNIADSNGYVLPGRSGAALLDRDGAIVALLSRCYEGTCYSCRVTPAQLGAIGRIVDGGD